MYIALAGLGFFSRVLHLVPPRPRAMSDSAVVQVAPERAFKDSERSSTISSGTHVPLPADLDQPQPLADGGDALELDNKKPDNVLHGGEGESAFPEDKKVRGFHWWRPRVSGALGIETAEQTRGAADRKRRWKMRRTTGRMTR